MQLQALLQQTFGFPGFRANQEAVCRAASDGRDVLLVMPTGAGKSLCYQLPTLARGGTGLVISPLIALMDDQAAKLSAAGLRVARIHSGLSREDARAACRQYLDGTLQFLFIAPERMRVPGFPEMLAKRKPSLIAIDEAHCISAWGHDFRPDYRALGTYLPSLRPAPVIALTATATPAVQRDIVTQLSLDRPALFIHGFRRDNLAIEVVEVSKPQRTEFAAKFLADKARRPAIVYAPSRKAAEELAGQLGRHFPAAAYHAGLDPGTRERVQREFLAGRLEVVVATIAFGMGVDKADVRTVIHVALPASVESYYQEIGRAGRDGKPSTTVLLWNFADKRMHEFFLERDYPVASELSRVARILTDEFEEAEPLWRRLKMDVETFQRSVDKLAAQGAAQIDINGHIRRLANAQWQSGYEAQVAFRREQIDRMAEFANTQQCRMAALIRHFGDTADAHRTCGHCDFCAPEKTSAHTSREPSAQEDRSLRAILRALAEAARSPSTGKLFEQLALTKDRSEFESWLDGLVRAGLVAIENTTFVNPEGKVVPFRKASLTYEGRELTPTEPLGVLLRGNPDGSASAPATRSRRAAKPATDADTAAFTPEQKQLEANLRAWRKAEAAKTGKPAFIVFGDQALSKLVVSRPRTLGELLQVSGFGPDKVDRYGADLCALCRGEQANPENLTAEHGLLRATKGPGKEAGRPDPLPAASQVRVPHVSPLRHGSVNPPNNGSAEPRTFHRDRPQTDPSASLTADQRNLEERLRTWRKSESERMGLPQFFVLGTSTLREIVLERPRTLKQLQSIQGIGQEKLDRFGPSILEVCNA